MKFSYEESKNPPVDKVTPNITFKIKGFSMLDENN